MNPATGGYRTEAHRAISKTFFQKRFFGYIPDADHKRRQKDAALWLKGGALPPEASLGDFRAPIFDQGGTGSCVGHGTAQAVYTSAGASGKPLPFVPSPRVTYALTRILERQSATDPLADNGAMPSDVLTVLRLYGVAPIQAPTPDGRYSDVWGPDDNPASPNVNDEPSLVDLEVAGLRLLTGEYRIDETTAAFSDQIAQSIVKKAAAGIGIFVDTAFMNWQASSGPITGIDLKDRNGGGHWLSLDYYYTHTKLGRVFGGPNSWGTSWASSNGPPLESPYWRPGCYEITATELQKVCSDCLLFPITVIS